MNCLNDSRFRRVMGKVQAEEALKEKTAEYLNGMIRKKASGSDSHRLRKSFVYLCISAVILLSVIPAGMFFSPDGYIDIDVNPSVELTVNCFGVVIDARAYNEDGISVLSQADIQYKKISEALRLLLDTMEKQGYMTEEGLLSVTVQSNDKKRETQFLDGLKSAAAEYMKSYRKNITADIFAVNEEIKSYASENLVSPARYIAITELQAVDPQATFDSCRNHSVSELKKMTKEHKHEHQGGDPDGGGSGGGGHKHSGPGHE